MDRARAGGAETVTSRPKSPEAVWARTTFRPLDIYNQSGEDGSGDVPPL
jgi:hypothetical protein